MMHTKFPLSSRKSEKVRQRVKEKDGDVMYLPEPKKRRTRPAVACELTAQLQPNGKHGNRASPNDDEDRVKSSGVVAPHGPDQREPKRECESNVMSAFYRNRKNNIKIKINRCR